MNLCYNNRTAVGSLSFIAVFGKIAPQFFKYHGNSKRPPQTIHFKG